MTKETYVQLTLFDDTNDCIDVVEYFISIQESIDPVWWACRWSDMLVYATFLNPNQKPNGCMAQGKKYPFNVWAFVRKANKDEFINNGISKVKSNWQ